MNPFSAFLICCAVVPGALSAQGTFLSAAPERPDPGAIVRLTLQGAPSPDSLAAIRGEMAGEPLHFTATTPGTFRALGPVPVDGPDSVVALVLVEHRSGFVDTIRTAVRVRRAPAPKSRPLAVDSRFTQPLDSATAARIARENARAREIGRRAHDSPPRWTASFLRPRTSPVTSPFGSGRVFNGQVQSRHLGVDFEGATGDTVRAANRGVVALVDDFFLAGKVVYVDHGGGVVTGYFHLSKSLVAAGDTVTRGQRIGLVGATGRVTGAHLHWNARYGGLTVNPLDLVAVGALK